MAADAVAGCNCKRLIEWNCLEAFVWKSEDYVILCMARNYNRIIMGVG